jgi:hypothetical protein
MRESLARVPVKRDVARENPLVAIGWRCNRKLARDQHHAGGVRRLQFGIRHHAAHRSGTQRSGSAEDGRPGAWLHLSSPRVSSLTHDERDGRTAHTSACSPRWENMHDEDGQLRVNGHAIPLQTTNYEGLPS